MNKDQKKIIKAESEYTLKRGMLVKLPVYMDNDKLNLYNGTYHGIEVFHIAFSKLNSGILTYYGYRLNKKDVFEFPQGCGDKKLRSYYVDTKDKAVEFSYEIPHSYYDEPDTVLEHTLIYETY